MLKLGIVLVGVVVLGLGLLVWRSYVSVKEDSLSNYMHGLMNAPNQDGILIISISGTSKFVQFNGGLGGAQMDFPLVTPEQKAFRSSIEAVANSMGLTSVINTGTDDSEFLDYDLQGSPMDISNAVEAFLSKLYRNTEIEKLRFEKYGY